MHHKVTHLRKFLKNVFIVYFFSKKKKKWLYTWVGSQGLMYSLYEGDGP